MLWELEDQLGLPGRAILEPLVRRLLLPVIAVISFFSGARAIGSWSTVLEYVNRTPFNQADPLFGRDLGFYFFELPFWRLLYAWSTALVAGTLVLVAAVYVLQRSLVLTARGPRLAAGARTHLLGLAALLLVLRGVGFWLDRFDLLYSPRGFVFGASYTDVHASLPVLQWLVVLAVLCAAACVFQMFRPGWRFLVAGLVVLVVLWVAGLGIAPALLQSYRVKPNELGVRAAVHREQYPDDPAGLRPRPGGREGLRGGGQPDPRRARAEQPHDQEHPALGPPAAAHHLRQAAGDPDLLQVPGRGRGPLHAERRVPPGDPVRRASSPTATCRAGAGSTST